MNTTHFLRTGTALAAGAALWATTQNAGAQFYITSDPTFGYNTAAVIGAYNMDGTVINSSLASVPGAYPGALTWAGNDLYAAYNLSSGSWQIGEFATGGGTVNASLFTFNSVEGLVYSGGNLFANLFGNVGVYNPATGTTNNSDLVLLRGASDGIAVSGGNIYDAGIEADQIYVYNDTTGATVGAGVSIPGNYYLKAIAIDGNDLFVLSTDEYDIDGHIGEYNLTTGAAINTSLVSNLESPGSTIAVDFGDILVTTDNGSRVSEYNETNGALINADLVSGVDITSIAIPEPTTLALAGLGGLSLLLARRRQP